MAAKKKRKSYTRQNVKSRFEILDEESKAKQKFNASRKSRSQPKAETTPKPKPKAKASRAESPLDYDKRGTRIPKSRRAATKLGRLKAKVGGKLRANQRRGAARAAEALDKARKTKAIKSFDRKLKISECHQTI